MSGARSSPRSPATFSPSLLPFFLHFHAGRRSEKPRVRATNELSFVVALLRLREIARSNVAGRSLSNPSAGFVGKSAYTRGNFNAWNSRPLTSRVTARDSLENVELRFSDECRSGCRDKKCLIAE
ncbi:hypothetical protein EAG_11681 [Camponotus floridanus]|uniref:Uncharacterized protein n=1 Tax=Camponotus floridanus TaxID=104421 RepID=E2AFZ8_CAMFO|nr:hypothetical protein EAG_11681 [Camponotus floridanus]